MEAAGQTGGGGGGGSGGPAPFLVKTYEMVDDSSTDDIVSWSDTNASFVVWNHADFAARLLPTYFKHNNFSSFIRQLNTYGFRKIDPERWEFANEDFIKGQKHLLKNIHRRKPIHSHSHPPGAAGGLPDAERAALEDEIERLTREKAALQADLLRFRQHQPRQRAELDELDVRLRAMELRQERMIAFLHRALQSPAFMENLVRMAGADPTDFSAIHKKRRLPPSGDCCEEAPETGFFDNHSSTSKPEIGHLFRRDFCDKLKLELSPAFSDCNLVSASTQSSNEEEGSPQGRQPDVGANLRMECLSLVPDALELSDTGTTFCPRKNVLCPRSVDDGNGFIPCHLNLTLASTSMQMDTIYHSPGADADLGDQGPSDSIERMTSTKDREEDSGGNTKDANVPSQQDTTRSSNQVPVAPQGRVNDVFWEQFLTERPGSSDTEEASSTLRVNSCEEQQEERKEGNEGIWRNRADMEQLTL